MRRSVWFYLGFLVVLVNCTLYIFDARVFEAAVIGSIMGLTVMITGIEPH